MTLGVLKEGAKLLKEKHSKKFRGNLFINANDVIMLNEMHYKNSKEIGLPNNINIDFANISGDIALTNLNKRSVWKEKGIIKGITFNPEYFNVLTMDEIKTMLWHEYGHMIYAYFFPDNFKKGVTLSKEGRKYRKIEELFVDTLVYYKFGSKYVKALNKTGYYMGNKRGKPKKEIDERIKKNVAFFDIIKNNGKQYWKEEAKKSGVSIKYSPNNSAIKGVKFDRSLLNGLY